MYNAEQLMEDIQNIAKSLDINSIKILYSINEKEEFIYSSEIYVRVYGNPSNIKYDEYKKLEDFCAKNNISYIDFKSLEEEIVDNDFGYTESIYFMMIENNKKRQGSYELYSISISERVKNNSVVKSITNYELKDKQYKELLIEKIEELMLLGYKNETDLKVGKFKKLKKEIETISNKITSIKIDNVEIKVDEEKVLIILNTKDNPENITYKEFEIIQNKHITLIYNGKEIMDYSLEPRDFRNVVFCSMDISPHKVVKSIKGTKGEGLRPIIKRLEKSGYTLDL